ncbi:glycosyltransferase family 39 protein [Acidobacteria bacterium AB60]|nr:glycosyltransferase family 39 protein [Acidobacteria bacterium AB60]
MEPAPFSQLNQDRFVFRSRRGILSAGAAMVAGAALRLWMLRKFFEVNGDSQLYGSMAKNLLMHGRYAVSDGGGMLHSTLIRLPGYPLFLALCFRIFGMENYFWASCVQVVLELLGCWLLAVVAYRVSAPATRAAAAHATLWLAALCPFTAVYAAEPLSEALTLFSIAVALWGLVRYREQPVWGPALAFTFAVTYAALLRPDGVLLGAALVVPLLRAPRSWLAGASGKSGNAHRRMLAVCFVLAVVPFALWAVRNARVFHVFQPLAPRYATDPGENTWPGWQGWTKTWCLDFISTYQVYWAMPGSPLEMKYLPARATDTPAQYAETAKLFADYESNGEELSPELDARFAQLAAQRISAHPLRSHLLLPLGRMLDMWLRPRVENLPIDLDWWVYSHHHVETRFSWFYAGLNAVYLLLGIAGLLARPRLWPWMLLYMLLRSALLCTIEAPEARYTLECFPMLFVLGGAALGRIFVRSKKTLA